MFKLADSKLLRPNSILAVDNVISPKDMHKPFVDTIEENDNYQKVTLDLGKGLLIALKLK
jgi:predicted O-methyltransferase YrrM